MADIKLTKLPDRVPVKLTISVPPDLHRALSEYAAIYNRSYGEEEPLVELVPHMLAAFLASDRGFAKARSKGEGRMSSFLTRPAFAAAPVIHLTMEQVIDRVGLRKSKIYELIRAGDFPDSMKLSPGAARWNEADIDGWIARMKRDCRG